MPSERTNNFPWKWAWFRSRDPYNFLAVRSAILATAWLLVIMKSCGEYIRRATHKTQKSISFAFEKSISAAHARTSHAASPWSIGFTSSATILSDLMMSIWTSRCRFKAAEITEKMLRRMSVTSGHELRAADEDRRNWRYIRLCIAVCLSLAAFKVL